MKQGYKGYKAYSYLEEGKDYPKFEYPAWDWINNNYRVKE